MLKFKKIVFDNNWSIMSYSNNLKYVYFKVALQDDIY